MTFKIIDKNWHELFNDSSVIAQKCALIISPFLGEKVLKDLLGNRPEEVKVITRFNLNELLLRVSDVKALEYLLKIGAQIKGVRNLHSKVYILGTSKAIVTSANLTRAGLYRNTECGVESEDSDFVKAADAYFNSLWYKAGPILSTSVLAEWKRLISKAKRSGAGFEKGSLGDFGIDLGFDKDDKMTQNKPPIGIQPKQWFVKLFGTGHDRESNETLVFDEVIGSDSHRVLSYPANKRPRSVNEGDLIFIGRMVKDPDDIMIYGRVRGLKHDPKIDNATPEDIKLRKWQKEWSRYIRVYQTEFVNGTLGDCISLYKLIDELGPDIFVTTQSNAKRGKGNINPKHAYRSQAAVRLTEKAARILNARLDGVFSNIGQLSQKELNKIN
jgi:hypothetical protein